jgi:Putative auto-transporter adhesin, head GIN domain
MKNSNRIILGLFFLSTLANAQWSKEDKIQGNGNVITKTITTSDYDKVLVSGFYDVDLVSGSEGKITISGEENLLEYVKIEVEDNALKISTEKRMYLRTTKGKSIRITVPFESLNEVNLSGSGDINSKNTIVTSQFSTSLSGSGDINLMVEAKEIMAKVTGSGDMVLKGKSDDLKCSVTGSGDLNAFGLESENVNAAVTGSGNSKVYCTELLEARVTGSGDIDYKGNPKKKDTKTAGSGSITKA